MAHETQVGRLTEIVQFLREYFWRCFSSGIICIYIQRPVLPRKGSTTTGHGPEW